jgi:hypothetical protein
MKLCVAVPHRMFWFFFQLSAFPFFSQSPHLICFQFSSFLFSRYPVFRKQSFWLPFSEYAFRFILFEAGPFYYDDLEFSDCPRRYTLVVSNPDLLDSCFFRGWSERRFKDFFKSYIRTTASQGEDETPILYSPFLAEEAGRRNHRGSRETEPQRKQGDRTTEEASVQGDMNYDEEGDIEYKQFLFKLKVNCTVSHYQEQTEEFPAR